MAVLDDLAMDGHSGLEINDLAQMNESLKMYYLAAENGSKSIL